MRVPSLYGWALGVILRSRFDTNWHDFSVLFAIAHLKHNYFFHFSIAYLRQSSFFPSCSLLLG